MPPTPRNPGRQRAVLDEDSATLEATDRRRALLLTALFLCVVAAGTLNHEMWRDEWQAWMIARDSVSFSDLLRNIKPEGHPPGWFIILFALSRLSRSAALMQAFHVAVATASVYLLARYSPFRWLHKVLIAFGYFFVYEYAVIARPYAPVVLALFAFCALFPHRRRHPVPLIASLVALALFSVYGMIIAIAAAGMLLLELAIVGGQGERWSLRHPGTRGGIIVGVVAIGAAAFVMQPPDRLPVRRNTAQMTSRWAIAETVSVVGHAYLPIPDVSARSLWNTHLVPEGGRTWLAWRLGMSLFLLAGALLLLARKPFVLYMFCVATFGLLLFEHIVFAGTLRHHGHLFVLLVACLWLAQMPGREWALPGPLRDRAGLTVPGRAFFLVLLVVQFVAAAILYVADLRGPFSRSPDVAEFLREAGIEHLPVAVSPAPASSPIAGLLDRPVYYVAKQSSGTFVRWGEYARPYDLHLTMARLRPFIEEAGAESLVILGDPFDKWDEDLAVTELARFEPGLEHREGYVVYRVERRP